MLGECGLIEHHIRGLRQCIEHHHRGMRPISKATACRRRLVDAIMSAGVHFQHVQPLVAVLLQETGVLNTAQFVDMEVERFGLEVLHEVVHDYRCCERLLTATPDMAGTLLDKTELTQCDLTVDDNFNVVDVRTRGATFSPMDDLNALRESIHRRLSGYIRPRSPKQPLSDKAVQFDPACKQRRYRRRYREMNDAQPVVQAVPSSSWRSRILLLALALKRLHLRCGRSYKVTVLWEP